MERINVENISKSFNLNFKKNEGALFRIVSLAKSQKENKIQVLDNVSLKADAGEIIGVVGANGSGKSTLLRIIAGIYQKDSGKITTNGRMIYLSGFGQALKPKLSMKENILLIGSVMGLSQKDMKSKTKDIVEFSGLEGFLDMKVNQFSSGMVARLSFSIGIHCLKHHNPEIVLLDEVFGSGGDMDFQNRAAIKMEEFILGGATAILVSHDMEIVGRYCKRAIFLHKGKIIECGDCKKVIENYTNFSK